MSNKEYYLIEAERAIAAICKEAKDWQDREENIISAAKFLTALIGCMAALLWLAGTWVWIVLAILAPLFLCVIPSTRKRMALRKIRYDEQLERAIDRRDSIKRQQKGF